MARALATILLLAAALSGPGCRRDDGGCPDGQTLCGAVCRDPASFASDPDNCGACGVACGLGTCEAGACRCDAAAGASLCPAGNPRCVNLDTDARSCGGCGQACGKEGAQCRGGVCGCFPPAADDCGAYCTDTQTDARSCGIDAAAGCGHVCPLANDVCVAGSCRCPQALPDECPDPPTACVDLQTDARNCGACGNVCALADEVCSGGGCACPAALPDRCPSADPPACVDLGTDEANCGTCGARCPSGATCAGTTPTCRCPADRPDVCADACVSRATDEQNCGQCGALCASGAACTAGSCACPAGQTVICGPSPGSCCAGTACCGSTCQTAHANGLGQSYYDCGATDAWTQAQAALAARAWNPAGAPQPAGQCPVYCLCMATATSAAVWCYQGSNAPGLVLVTPSPNCPAAWCPYPGNGAAWH